jgi:hypothetical protein
LRSQNDDYQVIADANYGKVIQFKDFEIEAILSNQYALEEVAGRKGYDKLFQSHNFQVPKPDTQIYDGKGLTLLPTLNDVNGMPQTGRNLVVIAEVNQALHFRIFDSDGTKAVDTNEASLMGKGQEIGELKELLKRSWPPKALEGPEKDRLFKRATALVGYNGFPEGVYDDVQLQSIADMVSIAAGNDPTRNAPNGSEATWFLMRLRAGKALSGHLVAIEVAGTDPQTQRFRLMDPNNGCFKFDNKASFKEWLLERFFGNTGYRQSYTQRVKIHKVTSVQPNPESIPTMIFSAISSISSKWDSIWS